VKIEKIAQDLILLHVSSRFHLQLPGHGCPDGGYNQKGADIRSVIPVIGQELQGVCVDEWPKMICTFCPSMAHSQ
jgi:hypothetical protein